MSLTIGERIRDIRKARKISQETLAELSHLARISIARYETNVFEPSADALSKIADALSVSVDVLMGRTSDGQMPNDDLEIKLIRDRVRNDPAYRTLFDAASRAKPENLRAAAAMLKALEENQK